MLKIQTNEIPSISVTDIHFSDTLGFKGRCFFSLNGIEYVYLARFLSTERQRFHLSYRMTFCSKDLAS